MKCPQCNEELTPMLPQSVEPEKWQDVDFVCVNDHRYFVRIKEYDLLEA